MWTVNVYNMYMYIIQLVIIIIIIFIFLQIGLQIYERLYDKKGTYRIKLYEVLR